MLVHKSVEIEQTHLGLELFVWAIVYLASSFCTKYRFWSNLRVGVDENDNKGLHSRGTILIPANVWTNSAWLAVRHTLSVREAGISIFRRRTIKRHPRACTSIRSVFLILRRLHEVMRKRLAAGGDIYFKRELLSCGLMIGNVPSSWYRTPL